MATMNETGSGMSRYGKVAVLMGGRSAEREEAGVEMTDEHALERDEQTLLTFFDFPAEHWKHLRTSNVVESPFATVRLRQRVTKGPGSRSKGITMAFKLLEMAQQRWRRINGADLLPLVREGATFVNGTRVERDIHQPEPEKIAA